MGFFPKGKVRYRYGVAKSLGSYTVEECLAQLKVCYDNSVVLNGKVPFRDGIIDILAKAEGDLDGDGKVNELFIPDEPPKRVINVNPGVY